MSVFKDVIIEQERIQINKKWFTRTALQNYKNIFMILGIICIVIGCAIFPFGGFIGVFVGLICIYFSISYNKILKQPINKNSVQANGFATSPTAPAPEKIVVNWSDLNFDVVADKYATSQIGSCKSIYDFDTYLSEEFKCLINNLINIDIAVTNEKTPKQSLSNMPPFLSKNITVKTPIQKIKDFIVIDTETTGLGTRGTDIIEVSAIKFIDFKPCEIFTTLLKSKNPVPEAASNVNNITDEMIADKPFFYQVAPALNKFIGAYPIVGHNIMFDIKHLFVGGLPLNEKQVMYDTLELSRRRIKDYNGEPLDSYRLTSICDYLGIAMDGAHRASADALATGLLFNQIVLSIKQSNDLSDLL